LEAAERSEAGKSGWTGQAAEREERERSEEKKQDRCGADLWACCHVAATPSKPSDDKKRTVLRI
jgi:hypothetical protein